jgi:hypothetical protein
MDLLLFPKINLKLSGRISKCFGDSAELTASKNGIKKEEFQACFQTVAESLDFVF